MRSTAVGHWKLTMTSWEQSLELILLELQKLPKNSTQTILCSPGIWSKLERWKSSISGCLIKWLQIKKKKIILNCCLLLFYPTTTNHVSIRLRCAMKIGLHKTGNDQRSGWTKKKSQSTSQSQTCTKKGDGPCLVVWCLSDPLQLSESWPDHYIWEVCSANWWDVPKTAMPPTSAGQQNRPSSSPRQPPTTCHTSSASEVEQIGLWSFASSAIITWPPANQLPLLQASQQLMAGKMLPQPGGRKCFPRVHWIPRHRFSCQGNKLISHWQKCVDCNSPYFD